MSKVSWCDSIKTEEVPRTYLIFSFGRTVHSRNMKSCRIFIKYWYDSTELHVLKLHVFEAFQQLNPEMFTSTPKLWGCSQIEYKNAISESPPPLLLLYQWAHPPPFPLRFFGTVLCLSIISWVKPKWKTIVKVSFFTVFTLKYSK